MFTITINGNAVVARPEDSVLDAALRADIYIPTICYHPDLPPRKGGKAVEAIYQGQARHDHDPSRLPGWALETGCGLCAVEMEGSGELVQACTTPVAEGMKILTETDTLRNRRRGRLMEILKGHPHACLTCAERYGCSRTECSTDVPENERCCAQWGDCELQRVAEHIGIDPATPRWVPTHVPVINEEPLIARDYNLCIGCTRCVRACKDLRDIHAIGFVVETDGKIRVGSHAPMLRDSGCKFCTACVEVCPTGAITDKPPLVGERDKQLLPCVDACPAGIDIPWYLRLVADGRVDDALAVIREKVPFPGILGRVCVRPCEQACRRGELDDPIAICAIKGYAADKGSDAWKKARTVHPDTGKTVAVVGSGPAGLTAAYYLRLKGHGVTIFDAKDRPGGMMRYGIPRYRLPEWVVDEEINEILSLGVEFRPETAIGRDVTLGELRADFDVVFLATGKSRDLGFLEDQGIDLHGSLLSIDRKSMQTNVPGVFAGGDITEYPGAIVHAVAAGRAAASSIDKYLGGFGDIDETLCPRPPLDHKLGREEGYAYVRRRESRKFPMVGKTGFRDVDREFEESEAELEAHRCLQCDLRLALGSVPPPPAFVLEFTRENADTVPESAGVFRIMDEDMNPIAVKGTANLRALLLEHLESLEDARFFTYEENEMFTKRESELVQEHLRKYGEMPGVLDDDDLF